MEKDTEISNDDANTIQDEKDVLMGVPTAASETGLEVVIDLKKKYDLSETMGEAPSKHSLIFPISVKESDLDSLISYVNQSMMTASDGMKELDGSSFGKKIPEELQPKGFESIQNPIPELMGIGQCMLDEKHLDCFNKGHLLNSCKDGLLIN